ncbi:MAG TPA: magnesium/cobalt transporter CorA [Steroidobacteraceae bacterium]|jgi:magnesium transporter|nr:magnesium/cobalt transporter CorA [Steroidobacteraceae bacterium]
MLINCVAYQDGKRLGEIEPGEIHNYLAKPGCFVWVALLERDPQTLELMQAQFGLHELAVEDAQNGHQRPKIEDYGDSLFVVLHLLEPESDGLRVGEVDVFAGPNYILTIRSHAEKGFQAVRARCESEPELMSLGSGYVLYALIDAVVDRYFPLLDALETELEGIEDRIFAGGSPRENVEALYGLKQKLGVFRHAVAPLLEAVNNLYGARASRVSAGMKEYFRDVSDHLQRLNQTIESIRDTIATAIAVNLSMISLEENGTMKRLAAYGALVAVPTLIAGIYGMNFKYMPELGWEYGYLVTMGVMIAVDGYLFYRLRRAKWL